jgi:hypothetical protein
VFTSFGIVNAVPAKTMAGYVASGEFTPIYLLAGHYVSWLRLLVPLTGFTAVFAAFSAISIAASRQLYALGREGLAPKMFGRTDKNKTPWNAQLLVLICCAVLPILISLYQQHNPLLAFGWIGEAYVFFILIPYTLTCVANILPPAFPPRRLQLGDQPAAAGPRHRDQRLYLLQELLPDVRAAPDQLRHADLDHGRVRHRPGAGRGVHGAGDPPHRQAHPAARVHRG